MLAQDEKCAHSFIEYFNFSQHLIISFGFLWAFPPPPNQNPAYAYGANGNKLEKRLGEEIKIHNSMKSLDFE